MPVDLLPYEAVAIAGICKALRGSNLPSRRPSYSAPSFWARPIYTTNYLPIPPNTGWIDLVTVSGQPQYVAIIRQYVATSLGSLSASGLQFRMLLNGQPLTSVSLLAGVDVNKDGPNSYPIIPRSIFVPVNETQTLKIQVMNPTGFQQIAIGLLAGWFIDSMDSTITSDSNAMVDGVYTPFVGTTYGK